MSFYQVTVDDEVLADQSHPKFRMSAGKLKQQVSNAGSLNITIPKKNTVQRKITKMESVIEVLHDERPIWSGRCNAIEEIGVGKVKIGAEGMLCALKDTILAPQTFSGFDYQLLDAIIAAHNSAASNVYQRFTSFAQHAPHFIHTLDLENYATAWAVLEAFLKECGGFFLPVCSGIDMKNGILWDCQFTDRCEQVIREGVGLLSFKRTQKADGTYNAILPTGKLPKAQQTEGGDNNLYLTGYSYSNGLYVSEASSKLLELNISPRFRRVMYKHYNDIETQADLAAAAVNDLEAKSKESDIVEVKALDMSYYDPTVPPLEPGKLGRVCATRYDYDDWLPVVEKELDLVEPWKSTVVLGGSRSAISSMTGGGGSSSGGSISSSAGSGSGSSSGQVGPQGPAGPQGPQGPQGPAGADGEDGADGVSPTVTVTDITGGHRVTITDATGTQTFDVMDGNSSGLENVVSMTKTNGVWQLDSSGMWRTLWNHFEEEILLIAVDGTNVRHLYKVGAEYTSSSSVTSVDIYFSDQRYNSSTVEGKAFKLTVPETGNGTITEITGTDIPAGGGSGNIVMFYVNESTLAVTDSTATAVNGRTILNACWTNCVVLRGTERVENNLIYHCYHLLNDDLADGEKVRFFRPTSDGMVMLTIGAASSTATRTVYQRPPFLSLDLGTDGQVKYKGTAVTGAWVAGKMDEWKVGACLVNEGTEKFTYWMSERDQTGLCFTRNYNNLLWTMYLPMDSTQITITTEKDIVDPYIIQITVENGVYSLVPGITWAKILENINNCLLSYSGYFQMSGRYVSTNDTILLFTRTEYFGFERRTIAFKLRHSPATETVTITRTDDFSITGGSNLYYLDGTTVKSAGTNEAVTGQTIRDRFSASGIPPLIYMTSTKYLGYVEFHLSGSGSPGLFFRSLDGAYEMLLPYNRSTAGIVGRSDNSPYFVSAVFDDEQNKFVLKRWDFDGNFSDATYNNVVDNIYTLWLNRSLPVKKVTGTEGNYTITFVDEVFLSGGITYTVWTVVANATNGVSVTRDVFTR